MESYHEERGMIPFSPFASNFGNVSTNDTNFDQLLDLILGEETANFNTQGYDCDQHNNIGGEIWIAPPVLDFNVSTNHDIVTNCREHDEFPEEIEEETMDEEESTRNDKTTMKNSDNIVDRSRILISERRRRSSMKEKLYALRSLVPNITKMDKASIVGDAVLYLQGLQVRAKKLKVEIAGLESSMKRGDKSKSKTIQSSKKIKPTSLSDPSTKKIIKMDVLQLEERGYYIRIVSNKEKGVVTFLYKALACVTGFSVKSSNLAVSADTCAFNFTLDTTDREADVSLPDLKLWIATVFLNQGFEYEASACS